MPPSSSAEGRRRVFLVHGRDHRAREALIALLEAFDLRVIQWRDAADYAGGGAPYTGEIVKAGMEHADAVVVLLTPDDIGYVHPYFLKGTDGPHEREPTGQARLNVVFEAGMAMARAPKGVVFVEMGQVRKMSDVDGLNLIQLDNSLERRKDLSRRLQSVGLEVVTDTERWRTAGNFASGRLTSPSHSGKVNHKELVTGMITGLGPDDRPLIIVRSPRSGLYWPQSGLVVDREDRFSSSASFGRNDQADDGKDYILMLVCAKQATSASLLASRGQPMSTLPSDVSVLDEATVTRRQPISSDSGCTSHTATAQPGRA